MIEIVPGHRQVIHRKRVMIPGDAKNCVNEGIEIEEIKSRVPQKRRQLITATRATC